MSGLLRICTAGSVDDGKSTLIGRLLYDSRGVYEDQISSVEKASKNRTAGPIDFSLFTDGLRAEREQGITIDVAYRYFATARRKFILADTPGHEQYTRNMATGASTADVAILLVDARHGVREQTGGTRGSRGCSASRTSCSRSTRWTWSDFDRRCLRDRSARTSPARCPMRRTHAIPISALHGDNVIDAQRSGRRGSTAWPAAEYLETVDVERDARRRAVPDSRCSSSSGPIRTSAATPGRLCPDRVRVGDP